MNSGTFHSFEPQVHAYVDGELTGEELQEFSRRLDASPSLRNQVDELLQMKQGIRDAFDIEALPSVSQASIVVDRFRRITVAAALVAGIGLGWLGAQYFAIDPLQRIDRVAQEDLAGEQTVRVLIHLSRDDEESMQLALDSAETVLKHLAERELPARVQVIANGSGLAIFRADVSRAGERIASLDRRYGNLQFVACQNTLERYRKSLKRNIQLVPEVLKVDSGVVDIARKRANGWIYLSV